MKFQAPIPVPCSNLPGELLELILKQSSISSFDLPGCHGVCVQWRLISDQSSLPILACWIQSMVWGRQGQSLYKDLWERDKLGWPSIVLKTWWFKVCFVSATQRYVSPIPYILLMIWWKGITVQEVQFFWGVWHGAQEYTEVWQPEVYTRNLTMIFSSQCICLCFPHDGMLICLKARQEGRFCYSLSTMVQGHPRVGVKNTSRLAIEEDAGGNIKGTYLQL